MDCQVKCDTVPISAKNEVEAECHPGHFRLAASCLATNPKTAGATLHQILIACGVWEAIYILDGLIRNRSSIKPTTVHADTQGQNLPVFGLASLLGIELMSRIQN